MDSSLWTYLNNHLNYGSYEDIAIYSVEKSPLCPKGALRSPGASCIHNHQSLLILIDNTRD